MALTPAQEAIRRKVQETSKLNPEMDLVVDGKTYQLLYNNFAIKSIYKDMGLNLLGQSPDDIDFTDPDRLSTLLFWGLKTRHPEITLAGVDMLINIRHFMYLRTQIMMALSIFLPDEEDLPQSKAQPEDGSQDPT